MLQQRKPSTCCETHQAKSSKSDAHIAHTTGFGGAFTITSAADSSFTRVYLKGKRSVLRHGFKFQYLELADDEMRALLEHFATAWHCPAHLGLGKKTLKSIRI